MSQEYKHLTPEQVDHFLEHGWVRIPNAFTREKAEEFTHDVWARLGYDKNDKRTWKEEKIHMPYHKREDAATFAPKAWAAMCELLGGEERVEPKSAMWTDGFIVNLGRDETEGGKPDRENKVIDPKDLGNWHVDGDFFVHYLDSPEQGLLVIPIFEDILPRGGGTYISPDGINMIAKYLYEHPEGALPTGLSFTPQNSTVKFDFLQEIKTREKFVELTGKQGDVILMHPLMLHSASVNHTRIPRIITNPPVSLNKPFFSSPESGYSLVEQKTLKALGKDSLGGWKITEERRRIVPKRIEIQNKMKELELQRLKELEENMKGLGLKEEGKFTEVGA